MSNKFLYILALFFSLFFLSCASAVEDTVSDYAGIYTGVIPAADCPGISVVVILNTDGNYKMTYQYIDKSELLFTYTGNFKLNDDSKTITLNSNGLPFFYKVGKQSLTQLDLNQNEITGKLAKNYILKKINI